MVFPGFLLTVVYLVVGGEVVREGELFQTPRRQKWVLLWTKYSQGLCQLVDLF